jgi:hypothetical protein
MAFKMKGWSPFNKNGDDEQKRFKEWANTEEGKKALEKMKTERLEAMSGRAEPLYLDVLAGTKYLQYKIGKKLWDMGKKFRKSRKLK